MVCPIAAQPFGLHHRRIVGGVFNRQRRLVTDGHHQFQVIFLEAVSDRPFAGFFPEVCRCRCR